MGALAEGSAWDLRVCPAAQAATSENLIMSLVLKLVVSLSMNLIANLIVNLVLNRMVNLAVNLIGSRNPGAFFVDRKQL